jgi:23S rRNA (pseudouridine1915-N3)-methyltransferase
MKFVFFDFKTAKEPWFEEAQAVYTKKISGFVEYQVVTLKTLRQERDDKAAKKEFEAMELLKKISKDDFIILFDEKGQEQDSIKFSNTIEKARASGKKRMVFIVGGAFGVTDEVFNRAEVRICLSKMVMNHLVAETMAFEQIYRSLTIIHRIPYHNI